MRRPLLLVLCVSLAWTLACATAIGTDGERRLWQRQLASTSAKFTLVQTDVTTSVGTTSAVRTRVASATTRDDTTAIASSPSSSIAEVVSSESTTTIPTTSSTPVVPTTSSSSSTMVASNRTARQVSAIQSNVAVSSASASSASAKASAAAAKASSSFLQPGNRLFPVAVLMFIAIGIIGVMIGIFIIKKCCHRSRFADPRDYAIEEKRAGQIGLLDSPESFNSDEKSGAWEHRQQEDAGMRMTRSGLDFISQPYQQPSLAATPRSSHSTRAHQTHRRTATIILPPTPAVLHTPSRQPSHPPHSLRPSSPLHRTPSPGPGNATPPSRVHRVSVPTFDQASTHARSRSLAASSTRSAPLPHTPPPVPMKRPQPPLPAAQRQQHQRAATIAVYPQPHQPKDGSGLRYLYGERERNFRVVIDLDSVAREGTFGRSTRMGSAEGRVLG